MREIIGEEEKMSIDENQQEQERISKDEVKQLFQNQIEAIQELDNKVCNVFRILGCGTAEVKHSYFLRWLLHHNSFFVRFAEACGIDLCDIAKNCGIEPGELDLSRKINREETYLVKELDDIPISKDDDKYYIENSTYRHIDLNIISKNNYFSLTIENKVDSAEHDDQCISYYNFMMDKGEKARYKAVNNDNKFFVFLCRYIPEDYEYYGGIIPKNGLFVAKSEEKNEEEYYNMVNTSDTKMKYFNYRLITYRTVLDILKNSDFRKEFSDEVNNSDSDRTLNDSNQVHFEAFAEEILKQYINLLEEWDNMSSQYKMVFDNLSDDIKNKSFVSVINDIKELKKGEDDTDLGRFLDVAYEYYLQEKKRIDGIIKPALKAIISDQTAIKTNYGRGGYANAIPISIGNRDFIGYEDLVPFICETMKDKEDEVKNAYRIYKNRCVREKEKCKKTCDKITQEYKEKKISKESNDKRQAEAKDDCKKATKDLSVNFESAIKEHIKDITDNEEKDFKANPQDKKKIVLQTIDYRAPMSGNAEITIGIYAGLTTPYSKNLCALARKEKFSTNYNALLSKASQNDKIQWKCILKDGSAERSFYEKIVDYNKFYDFCKKNGSIVGRISFESILNGKINICQLKDNVFLSDEYEKIVEAILEYFTISKTDKNNVEKIFEKFQKKGKNTNFENEGIKKQAKKFLINLGIKDDLEHNKYFKLLCMKICLKDNGCEYGNKQLFLLWVCEQQYKIDKIKPVEIAQEFYYKTIEGMKLFGYDDYFKNHIFKNEDAIKNLKKMGSEGI